MAELKHTFKIVLQVCYKITKVTEDYNFETRMSSDKSTVYGTVTNTCSNKALT